MSKHLCLAIAIVVGAACTTDAQLPSPDVSYGSPCGPSVATVARIIDGDTVELDTGDNVRYLLIDTPESTGGADDCYGEEAKEFNRSLVEGQTVSLYYDVECEDMYGRLLAYVYVGDREVNRLMIERGYACVLHIPPNGEQYVDQYEDLEDDARDAGVGMWGACAVVTCD